MTGAGIFITPVIGYNYTSDIELRLNKSADKQPIVTLHVKLAMSDLQRYPKQLCLIKYKLDFHVVLWF